MQPRHLSAMAATALSFLGMLLLIVLASVFGPDLEPKISPVIRFGPTEKLYRDPDRICWLLTPEKLRWAADPHYEFYARPEQGPDIPTGAYLVDDNLVALPDQRVIAHAVGARWTRHYCFDVADRLPAIQKVTVIGHVEHRRHPFWTTVTPVPVFTVCPLGRMQDGRCGAR